VWANAVRLDFAAFITKRGRVFLTNQDGFANLFQCPAVLFEKLVHRQAVSVPAHGRFLFVLSILFGQEKGGHRSVGFGDDVQCLACGCLVSAEKPEPTFKTEGVFLSVLLAQFAPLCGIKQFLQAEVS